MTRFLPTATVVIFTCLGLSGCSIVNHVVNDANQVQRIVPEAGGTQKAADGRYENLFPKLTDYPVTCDDDCYPAHPDVVCETTAENCRYQGNSPNLAANTGFQIHWLGHATFLITTANDQQFLFDPVSEQFDFPINWAHSLSGGVTRKVPQWPTAEQLKDVDAILYSHLHYDHFNKTDIKRLGANPKYFVHLDTADYLPTAGLNLFEMDWFTTQKLGDTLVHAVPAHHFNGRYWVPFLYNDDEEALWGGWILEYNGKTLFFAGDTGYSEHFKEINAKYGDIDVCLLPIASYHHETHGKWYRYVHTTPEDALVAAKDLNCSVMIPWGYGNASWQMGDRSSHSPLLRLLKMQSEVHSELPIVILNEGEQVAL